VHALPMMQSAGGYVSIGWMVSQTGCRKVTEKTGEEQLEPQAIAQAEQGAVEWMSGSNRRS
jgi:hypothetical protein